MGLGVVCGGVLWKRDCAHERKKIKQVPLP